MLLNKLINVGLLLILLIPSVYGFESITSPASALSKKLGVIHLIGEKHDCKEDNDQKNLLKELANAGDIRLLDLSHKKIKLGWFSPWQAKCGIAEYSAFLLNEFEQDSMDIVVYSYSNNNNYLDYKFPVVPVISDGKYNFPLHTRVIDDKIDILVLQYNFQICPFRDLMRCVFYLINAKVKIVMVLHSMKGQFDKDLIQVLSMCDRILVHTLHDVDYLKSMGIVDNVIQILHGVINQLETETKDTIANDNQLTIGSYGFFLRHKGLFPLITAFYGVASVIKNAKLILINAEYPVKESRQEIDRCKEHAKKLGIYESIEWHTDFKSNSESLALMQKCDILVFPYQNTTESSSAAIRLGLASGKPVITTPIPIFDDVRNITYQTRGMRYKDIEENILKLFGDRNIQDSLTKKQREWLSNHDWKKVAKQMQEMIKGLVINVNVFKGIDKEKEYLEKPFFVIVGNEHIAFLKQNLLAQGLPVAENEDTYDRPLDQVAQRPELVKKEELVDKPEIVENFKTDALCIHPPFKIKCRITENKSKTKCTLKASWRPSKSEDIIKYNIYRKDKIIATISAGSALAFEKTLSKCRAKNYSITAVDKSGQESVHVKLKCSSKL